MSLSRARSFPLHCRLQAENAVSRGRPRVGWVGELELTKVTAIDNSRTCSAASCALRKVRSSPLPPACTSSQHCPLFLYRYPCTAGLYLSLAALPTETSYGAVQLERASLDAARSARAMLPKVSRGRGESALTERTPRLHNPIKSVDSNFLIKNT